MMRHQRQERIRKEDRKEERRQKREARAKESKKKEDGIKRTPDGDVMCCIPLVQCTRLGHPLPTTMEEGIKMECTNEGCIYTKHLVHPECFRSLEQGLLTILSNNGILYCLKGSARGWTEGHRKHNLWGKKGLSLVQRSLRCPCGKGQMKRDDEAWKEREELLDPSLKDKKEKKKHKPKTNLPVLQFANKTNTPAIDLKKVHELDTHYLSSHSPPPSDTYLEDRYGPLKAALAAAGVSTPATRTRSITGTSVASSNVTSISKNSIIAKKSSPLKAASRKPIGLAPIRSLTPKKPSLRLSQKSLLESSKEKSPVLQCNHNNKVDSNAVVAAAEPELSKPEGTQWQPKEQQPREATPIIEREKAMSPPNTTTSGTSFPSSTPGMDAFSNIIKNASVQTDETCFPIALFNNPWIKLYSPSEVPNDSGFHSTACSPKFLTEMFTRPMSPLDTANDEIIEAVEPKKTPVRPPPGFTPDRFKYLSKDEKEDGDEGKEKPQILPIPEDPVPCYSLFDGPTLGLGEEIAERIRNRTLLNHSGLVECKEHN